MQAGGGTLVLMAESGVGKSTLSRDYSDDWRQLADDMVCLEPSRTRICLDFPQLKLTNGASPQIVLNGEARPSITALLELRREPSDEIIIKPLDAAASLLVAAKHTVAAKLFDTYQLQNQMSELARLTQAIPTFAVHYPRDLNRLNEVRDAIRLRFGT